MLCNEVVIELQNHKSIKKVWKTIIQDQNQELQVCLQFI